MIWLGRALGWTLRHLENYMDRAYAAYLAARWPDKYQEKKS